MGEGDEEGWGVSFALQAIRFSGPGGFERIMFYEDLVTFDQVEGIHVALGRKRYCIRFATFEDEDGIVLQFDHNDDGEKEKDNMYKKLSDELLTYALHNPSTLFQLKHRHWDHKDG